MEIEKQFIEQSEYYGSYDVVVAGGGPAGIGAGIAAARGGLKVLLLEGNGFMGGVSTAGNLPIMLGATTGSIPFNKMMEQNLAFRDLPHPRKAVGGIFDVLVEKIKEQNGSDGIAVIPQTELYPGLDRLGCHDDFIFDIEVAKRVLDEMAAEVGLELLYYTHALKADIENNRVKGIWFTNKSGIVYAECNAIIDCTGDADIVARAGYETYKGDRETGEMTAVNLVTQIENVDSAAVEKYLNEGGDPWMRPACEAAQAENPDYRGPKNLIIFPMMQPGVFMINGGCGFPDIDGTNGKDLTKLTLMGRQRAKYLTEEVFRKHIPGAKNCRMRSTAVMPGVRETRRIVGEYMLTEEDLLNGTTFEDTIALAGRHFDLHRTKGQVFADTGRNVKLGVAPIPYRSLIPKGSHDVIVAGRCIAADGQALGPARIMSTCMAVGEAAGTAAVLKIKEDSSFVDVDYHVCHYYNRTRREQL